MTPIDRAVVAAGAATSATAGIPGPPALDDLAFTRVVAVPSSPDAEGLARLRSARVAGLLHAGACQARVAALWVRAKPYSELEVYLAGPEPAETTGEERALSFPLGARGLATPAGEVSRLLTRFPVWQECAGVFDPLARASRSEAADDQRGGTFDAQVDYLLHRAFAWLVVAEPCPEDSIGPEIRRLQ